MLSAWAAGSAQHREGSEEQMATTLLSCGLACIIAAVVGGGIDAFGVKIPKILSLRRQCLLAAFGFVLAIIGFHLGTRPQRFTQPASTLSWGPIMGGPGGGPFEISCEDDEILIGLSGRTNQQSDFRIFNIGPLCSKVRFEKAAWSSHITVRLLGEPTEGDHNGSQMGDPFTVRCPANEAVIGAVLSSVPSTTGEYLGNHLTIRCSKNVSGSEQGSIESISIPGQSINFATERSFECPKGQVASAIKGRAGQWIDALGIGCRNAR